MDWIIDIDDALWGSTRSGAAAGRGFRYQDATAAWFSVQAWASDTPWTVVVPEGVDDVTLHGESFELRAQLKSRHDPRAGFSIAEVARYLAKIALNLASQSRARIGLVLERPIEGLSHSGWETSLSDTNQDLGGLKLALADAMGQADTACVEALLQRSHVVVEPEPLEQAVAAITSRLSIPSSLARLIAQRLREDAGQRADANFLAAPSDAHRIDISHVQACVDSVIALVDANALDRAVRMGICEAVDFSRPLPREHFYEGTQM